MKLSSPAKSLTVRQFFGRRGLLSEWHPQYEFRPGQLEMAEAVEAAIEDRRHLIVEAGTGTGKTLAYLVPAILSGKRVVISTGTKNLQEQLFFKDIPFLQQHFSSPISACYMKGRAKLRLPAEDLRRRKGAGPDRAGGGRRFPDHPRLGAAAPRRATAPRSRSFPENSSAWAKIDARRETVHRAEVPAVRPLLHHRRCTAGRSKAT